jgi:hypothetical protein
MAAHPEACLQAAMDGAEHTAQTLASIACMLDATPPQQPRWRGRRLLARCPPTLVTQMATTWLPTPYAGGTVALPSSEWGPLPAAERFFEVLPHGEHHVLAPGARHNLHAQGQPLRGRAASYHRARPTREIIALQRHLTHDL